MAKRRKLTEESVTLDRSEDECRCSSSLGTNNDCEIDCISEISESSDESILDEFSQTQESMGKQYISKNKKEIQYSHTISP